MRMNVLNSLIDRSHVSESQSALARSVGNHGRFYDCNNLVDKKVLQMRKYDKAPKIILDVMSKLLLNH